MSARTVLFVLGMHRSGTSALARVLGLLGAQLPSRLLAPDWGNEAGYWEPEAAIRLHDRILASAGTSVNDARGPADAWFSTPAAQAFIEPMQQLAATEYGDGDLLLLKDPRSTLVFPLWRQALARMGIGCVAAIISRDPAEVAASLVERQRKASATQDWSPDRAGLLWLRYNLAAERHTRGMARAFCRYSDLLADWRAVAGRLASELELAWPMSPTAAGAEIDGFLQPSRRHHRSSDGVADPGGVWSDCIEPIDAQLGKAAAGGAVDGALFDAVADDVERTGAASGRSVAAAPAPTRQRPLVRVMRRRGNPQAKRLCLVGTRLWRGSTSGLALAQAATAAGIDLTIVDFAPAADPATAAFEAFARQHGYDVETVAATAPDIHPPFLEPTIRLYRYVRDQGFDAVLFQDEAGLGYASTVAKRTGQAFSRTSLGVISGGTSGQAREREKEFPTSLVAIGDEHLERRAVELSDFVVPDNAAALQFMAEDGWVLPPSAEAAGGEDGRAGAERDWPALLSRILSAETADAAVRRLPAESPDTTVIVTHFERPDLLDQNLRSLARQTDPNFSLIVVDDGSRCGEALAYLDSVAARYPALDPTVIRQDNRYVGAARNAGIAAAKTDFVILLDDDNLAFPALVESLRTAIHASGADVVTCGIRHFRDDGGSSDPDAEASGPEQFFSAGPLLLGAIHNCFGDVSGIYRMSVFAKVGGFHELHGVTFEDWHLHLRVAAAGLALHSLPEALVWYRVRQGSMLRSTSHFDNARVIAQVVEGLSGKALAPLSDYLIGSELQQVRLNGEVQRLAGALRSLQRATTMRAGRAEVADEAVSHARKLELMLADRTTSAEEAGRYARSLEAALTQLRADFQAASEYAASLELSRTRVEDYARGLEAELDILRRQAGQ